MVPEGCVLETEAVLRYLGARRLIDAVAGGEWEPTPELLAAIEILCAQGRRFYIAAGWTEQRAA